MPINLTKAEFNQIFKEQEEEENKTQEIAQKRLEIAQKRLELAQQKEERQARQEQAKAEAKAEQTKNNNDNLFYFTCIMQFITILTTFIIFIFIMR